MSDYNSDKNVDSAQATELGDDVVPTAPLDGAAVRRLVRKTDLIVMPALVLSYYTNTLDRANLGNAKTDGFEKDLHIVGNQYNLILVAFYVTYAVMTVPWTIAAKRFSPAVVMPILIAAWGLCTMCSVASKNFRDFIACRILMGVFEAAFLPCAVYYCSLFYTRKELGFRTAVFYQMGVIASATSGLISWSVFQWHRSLKGWQYLFLIEGAITIGMAIFLGIVLPRSPATCRWFSEEEKALARARLRIDSQDEHIKLTGRDILKQFRHGPTWVFTAMSLFHGVGFTSSSNFLPVIIKRLTVDSVKANLYTIGPNLESSVALLTASYLSDRLGQRALFASGTLVVSLIGFVLLGTLDLVHHVGVGYFLTFLITFGVFTPGLLTPVWQSSNVPTTGGRAVALGMSYFGQNVAGIVSSLVFRTQDAPVYKPALVTAAVCQGCYIILALGLRQYYVRLNKKIDRGEIPHVEGMEGNPKYRYAI
ncbi:Major facilitator superfamily domain, general substrate transporter [Niveomyces insectorum RCEF 264]|uniref:Major facilitator superfamily domain, general substrate transporter n=1 Tax=Niveomyces insectorum RCEF 264 TaxID=1081102 RepID=A0A167W8L4_9HYPO|nr:Major facilitator superfamily domain, general substrate transporter [Niveomyces insectorum RCEF 264]